MPDSDANIFEGLRAGRADALRDAVHRHYKMIYALSLSWTGDRHAAEDLAQETFLRAFEAAPSATAENLGGWLAGIARNCTRENWRRGRRPAPPPPSEPAPPPETRHLAVLKAVSELPDDSREVVMLKYVENLSCEEVARRLNKPVGTVKSLLSRAYEHLRQTLKAVAS